MIFYMLGPTEKNQPTPYPRHKIGPHETRVRDRQKKDRHLVLEDKKGLRE